MIAIGEVLGEPEQDGAAIDRTIRAAMRAVAQIRGRDEIDVGPGVNIVFHVPGRLLAPDWDEIRVERFSRKRKVLLVSAPVPKQIVNSDVVTITTFVITSLRAAIRLAFQTLHKRGIEFPLADANELIDRIECKLQEIN